MLNYSQLVQEHDGDTERGDEADEEQPEAVSTDRSGAPVRELIAYHLAWRYPTDEDTGRERTEWKKNVRREEVAEVEEALSADGDVHCSAGEGTSDTDENSDDRLDDGTFRPGDMQFFKEQRRADLMHGDRRGEGCKSKERIEQDADDITQDRRERLLEDVRQCDEDQRRTTVGIDTD